MTLVLRGANSYHSDSSNLDFNNFPGEASFRTPFDGCSSRTCTPSEYLSHESFWKGPMFLFLPGVHKSSARPWLCCINNITQFGDVSRDSSSRIKLNYIYFPLTKEDFKLGRVQKCPGWRKAVS